MSVIEPQYNTELDEAKSWQHPNRDAAKIQLLNRFTNDVEVRKFFSVWLSRAGASNVKPLFTLFGHCHLSWLFLCGRVNVQRDDTKCLIYPELAQ